MFDDREIDVSFSRKKEIMKQISKHPEMALDLMVKRRHAEVLASTLTAEHNCE